MSGRMATCLLVASLGGLPLVALWSVSRLAEHEALSLVVAALAVPVWTAAAIFGLERIAR